MSVSEGELAGNGIVVYTGPGGGSAAGAIGIRIGSEEMNTMVSKWTFLTGALALVIALGAGSAGAVERVTFTKDVLPILQENCQQCHRPNGANLGGMVAPMSFMDYQDTRPWAKAIKKAVNTKAMPPWHAAPQHHGVFLNERTLTGAQIATVVKWVDTGAPMGDAKDMPAAKEFFDSGDWTIGEPDLVLSMPEPFFVDDDVEDSYENFYQTMSADILPEDRWIKAVEFRPGSSAVHHIITRPFGGIAPGNDPTVFPEGLGRLVKTGQEVRWAMHYHKEPGPGTGVWDQSSVAVIFYDKGEHVPYPVVTDSLGAFGWTIPAGDPDFSVSREWVFEQDSLLVRFMPHMHLRGKAALYEATYPDGRHEVLLNVPKYDFNWQTQYVFKEFPAMPKGTVITYTTWWDNSVDNPFNPDPTVDVGYGDPTTDEMSFGWMQYVSAEPVPNPSDSTD